MWLTYRCGANHDVPFGVVPLLDLPMLFMVMVITVKLLIYFIRRRRS